MDLFSLLPESLLLSIISFLPFKEAAARTFILNKKWLNIWQPGNNIDFNENFFVDSNSDEIKQSQRMIFINFITNWIAHYTNREVNKFSLTVSDPQTCNDTIERCVDFATQRGVKDLTLDFSDPKWEENDFNNHSALFVLPTQVYQLGSSLESIKLYSCSFAMLHFLNFNALKDVSLGWIEVKIDTLKTLLSTCRMVQSLSLKKCWNLAHFDLGDEPIGLTRLVLDKCNIDTEYVSFVAPNLKYFKYSGDVFTSDINVTPCVIDEVDIDFSLESQFHERGNELCKILEDLFAAKSLTVSSYLLQVIPSGDEPIRLQTDLNVRHLTLKTLMHPNEYCGFEFLLNSCPLLQKLTLDLGPQVIFDDYAPPSDMNLKKYWFGRRVIPQCLIRTLKVVEVIGMRATPDELMAYVFLIQVGRVLEHLNIYLWDQDGLREMRLGRAKLLLDSPRKSRNLQITID